MTARRKMVGQTLIPSSASIGWPFRASGLRERMCQQRPDLVNSRGNGADDSAGSEKDHNAPCNQNDVAPRAAHERVDPRPDSSV